MRFFVSKLIYNLLCNIPVCFFLCLTASLIHGGSIDWVNFGINYAVSFVSSMMIGLFIPLTKIGRWFTALFHVKNDTYKGNIKYRILATLIASLIFFIIINPTLTILNYFLLKTQTAYECFIDWLINAPLMLIVGFTSSFISDFLAYQAAHKIDDRF